MVAVEKRPPCLPEYTRQTLKKLPTLSSRRVEGGTQETASLSSRTIIAALKKLSPLPREEI
jgi:hypothetical protein